MDRNATAINRFLSPKEEKKVIKPPVLKEVLAIIVEEVVRTPKSTPKSSFSPKSPSGKHHGVANLTKTEDGDEEELYYALPPIVSLKEAIYHVRDLLDIADEKANLMDFEDVKALQRIKRKLEAVMVDSREQKTLDNWLAL